MKEKVGKSIVSKVINTIIWIVLIFWMITVITDYINVKKEKDPIFCWGEKTTEYSDGNVVQCTGLGYKVYKYNRETLKAIEFGPLWTKDRTANIK